MCSWCLIRLSLYISRIQFESTRCIWIKRAKNCVHYVFVVVSINSCSVPSLRNMTKGFDDPSWCNAGAQARLSELIKRTWYMARWWLKTQIPFARMIITGRFSLSFCYRLAVSDCAPQTSRVSSNLHSSSSMAVSRVPSPPPPEVNTPVAENWCYTQVRFAPRRARSRESRVVSRAEIRFKSPRVTEFHCKSILWARAKN